MTLRLTAIVCTHNPRPDHLGPTLEALRAQTLPLDEWEFLLVDNASDRPLDGRIDLSWHPGGRIVREDRLGLTFARLRSFEESQAPVLVYIDDDNLLDPTYLARVLDDFEADPQLGAVGGRSIPQYETPPPPWFDGLGIDLACRDLGDEPILASWSDGAARTYPAAAPVGAGMGLRREAYAAYVDGAAHDPRRTALGRSGTSLASGEDNDIILSVLAAGWRVGYDPALRLTHLIPSGRLTPAYLGRIAEGSSKTWVLVLGLHGIRPWARVARWSVPLRKARAYVRQRAWAGPAQRIGWRGACGQFDGRALLAP